MAANRLVIDGFGQIELNNAAFRRDGRIEAQCALSDTDFANVPAENGMLLAVDNIRRIVKLPVSGENYPIALVYSSEHIYDERTPGLKNFANRIGEFYPRLGYLAVGDKYTTNCISYDPTEFATEKDLTDAIADVETTPLYAGICVDTGAHLISATKPTEGPVLMVRRGFTMPDGTFGVQLYCVQA
jgi:hypothetical protein